jgi:uncharacterized protein (DUF952 family)/N-acetylglutamate synthase-like GNAT family acetyltransferase
VILHLLSRKSWVEAQVRGQLIAPSVATEGFAHCSTEHQMVDVANKYYRGNSDMVLLNIDPKKLASVLKFEPPAHLDGSPALPHEPLFPHIYGPINLDAVSEVIDFPCDEHGAFTAPLQLKTYSVVNIVDATQHWQRAAELSVVEWKEIFTEDSVQTYIDLYGQTGTYAGRLVETYVALSADDELVGMATLVDDDELPNAPEPGPWLAAVLALPTYRGRGVATAVVQRIVRQAHELGIPALYLYTSDQQQWYANKGWITLRETELNGIAHTVMTLRLTN